MNYRPMAGAALVLGAAVLAGPAVSQSAAPVARYTVDAGTMSGMAGMGAGGGMGAAMAMMRGGGGQVVHELLLRLGSSRAPTGAAKADHFMPAGAGLGASVPLTTPVRGPDGGPVPPGQMPKARLLLFWGCGEHAAKGQPVVIDFTKLAKGQVPPGLFAAGVNLPDDWQVLPSNSKTYGEWPNGTDRKVVPAKSSLVGAHKVTSTYAPEIGFSLADDFMPPLQARAAALGSGATAVNWGALPKATGYYAWAVGAAGRGGDTTDMIWWSSSSSQQFGGALAGWLSPAAVGKLIAAGTVMPATQTSCTIPAEVKQAGGEYLMTQLFAYGPQVDFAYPPRPANAKLAWKPEWIARVRFRANTALLPGLGEMGGGYGSAGAADDAASDAPSKPRCKKGLAGMAQRAAGLCE